MYRWRADSANATVWQTIRDAGEDGITVPKLQAAVKGITLGNIATLVSRMFRAGLVERSGIGHAHQPYLYRITAACRHPQRLYAMPQRAWELVEDCPAGIDEELIADELGRSIATTRDLLEKARELGLCYFIERGELCRGTGDARRRYVPIPVVPPARTASGSRP